MRRLLDASSLEDVEAVRNVWLAAGWSPVARVDQWLTRRPPRYMAGRPPVTFAELVAAVRRHLKRGQKTGSEETS